MKPLEQIDMDKLFEVCKQMNEVIDNKIELVGVSTPDIIKAFTARLENMSGEEQDKLPDAVNFYNDLYEDEQAQGQQSEAAGPATTTPETEPQTEGEEGKTEKKDKKPRKAKAKAEKKDKKPRKKKEKKEPAPPKEKDEFGFTVGTKNNLFIQAIKAQPMTMKEVKDLPWNVKKVTFYEITKKLVEEGVMERDEQGRMSVR